MPAWTQLPLEDFLTSRVYKKKLRANHPFDLKFSGDVAERWKFSA